MSPMLTSLKNTHTPVLHHLVRGHGEVATSNYFHGALPIGAVLSLVLQCLQTNKKDKVGPRKPVIISKGANNSIYSGYKV